MKTKTIRKAIRLLKEHHDQRALDIARELVDSGGEVHVGGAVSPFLLGEAATELCRIAALVNRLASAARRFAEAEVPRSRQVGFGGPSRN